ncbi:heterokaryon incompatibility protein-domain-containing protein [Ampelomyces quisqualis]|uniref:Heterokaryon incompatibility protein-domain-containing protein n=1 Tax=Ampelomyces quisqualis TaxID=50730 RepID=A0A6A5QBF3_AMPQU|nr:heterokaryon incompatibility protein-domain-containing protein [Ampelomyces quisqualis]
MTSSTTPRVPLIRSLDDCGTEENVRKFNNTLYVSQDGYSKLIVPEYKYVPLNIEPQTVRLLSLHTSNDSADHVRCNLETHHLTELPPFVAVKNARGYRNIEEAIEVDGQALRISAALERFLRYLRTQISQPTLIWVRYVCVLERDLTEQNAYWTREFSDRMYTLATEVIDMHDTNTRLVINGYFERVFHDQWGDWNKEWSGGHDQEVILPRVCPIRLGTNPNIDAPTMNFRYMPMDMIADEVRVMCIMPAKDGSAPIVLHVAHCPIKCEVTYMALSYRWGTDKTPEKIVMNGQRMSIRQNLAEAIRALRMQEQIVPIWIDALSINQENVAERGREVRRMGKIYHHAMSVYSIVGAADEDTQNVCKFISELVRHPVVRINDLNDFHFDDWGSSGDGGFWYGENRIEPQRLVKLCVALYRFLTREYFRRCWILQVSGMGLESYHFGSRKQAEYIVRFA